MSDIEKPEWPERLEQKIAVSTYKQMPHNHAMQPTVTSGLHPPVPAADGSR